jgi:hypothetical protein
VALGGEKLATGTTLVEEQLKAGHIEPTHSSWNTPIFVIRKRLGNWRLLQDLRAVNRVMQPMGMPQPGLLSPTAIPLAYCLCILDLKDAFFFLTIPLNPNDREKFAFTLSSPNHHGPECQFHWIVLPQGIANSPTMCQEFVAAAIEPTHCKYPEAYVLPYMDYVLISQPSESAAYIGHTSSEELFNIFFQLYSLVQTCLYPCFVSYLRSHSHFPSLLADGNAQADNLVSGLALGLLTPATASVEAAPLSHALYHQNASALRRQLHLTRELDKSLNHVNSVSYICH